VWRIARSSKNTRVSAVVQPQVRAHNSILKGSDVMVMGGPSRGMIGKVVTCLSGNWCMISDLLDTDDRNPNVVVHATKLKLIPMKSGIDMNQRLGNSSHRNRIAVTNIISKSNNEMINITHSEKNQMESTRCRIHNLQDEKEKLQKGTQDSSNNLALSQQAELNRINIAIKNAQTALKHHQIVDQMLGDY